MAQKLTDTIVKNLAVPDAGNRIAYDEAVKGFGVRVTAAGARAFVLNYRTRSGRERRYTIGAYPDWKTAAAREEAAKLKQAVDRGEDPLEGLQADRAAPTMAKLCERFLEEHAARKRDSTKIFYEGIISKWILPELRSRKVADIAFEDVDGLHRAITKKGKPYIANRTISVLSKMFNLAIKWKWRTDNPVKGIERNQEQKRQRYLSTSEIGRLSKALAEHEDQQAANILRLLLLTGARSEEVRAATWAQLDMADGVWIKPAANTKQKRDHRVPLSAPARLLLTEIKAAEEAKAHQKGRDLSPYVFPGRGGASFRDNIKRPWAEIIKAAGFTEHARIHDLRHTYASSSRAPGCRCR
jgi:integrase